VISATPRSADGALAPGRMAVSAAETRGIGAGRWQSRPEMAPLPGCLTVGMPTELAIRRQVMTWAYGASGAR
jgi:hypothetical protein